MNQPQPRRRIESVDLLRGTVMVLMALDHVRDFFGGTAVSPTNLATTTVPLFFTRWITHLCAPSFFLLTGTSAWFVMRRRSPAGLSRFLVTRGLWLLVLDAVVVRCFAFQFNFDYRVTVLNVLWALGWSMIALAGLARLPVRATLAIGVALIAGHNLLDPIRPAAFGALAPVWTVLHVQGFLVNSPRFVVLVAYPLIPWIGVTAVGFCLGKTFDWTPDRRRALLVRAGSLLTIGFVVLRWVNVYGDPSRWSVQRSPIFTAVSFLNTTKYPPSLLFLLMTLGPALLVLAWLEATRRRALGRALVTFGRVPLFFYLLQWFVAHGIGLGLSLAAGKPTSHLFGIPGATPPQPGAGFGLGVAYLAWAAGVALLYPLCRWFARVKRERGEWWLSYL
jgi:uncharacterized membrane protein